MKTFHHLTSFLLFALLLPVAAVGETPDSLQEIIPEGGTPVAEQRAAIVAWAGEVKECHVLYDAEGNVVRISVTGAEPGLDAEDFALLPSWPHLRSLHMQHQRPDRDSLAQLAALPEFEGICLMNIGNDPETGKPSLENAYIEVLFPLADRLRNLDLVHTFGYKLDQPPFEEWPELPALERLVLEGGGDENLQLFAKTPNLRVLGMHRSRMSPEALAQLPDLLPELRVLMIKPAAKDFDPTFLKAFQRLRHQETLTFHHYGPDKIGWENGMQLLVEMPQLNRVVFGGTTGQDWTAAERLQSARPDLEVAKGNYGPPVAGRDGRLLYFPRDVEAWTQADDIAPGGE